MPYKAEEITWYFKVINNAVRSKFDTNLKDEGLTKVQFEVLMFIHQRTQEGKKVIQRDLESHFHISNPSVSTMITRLELKKFLAREEGETDRRKRYVVLTQKAIDLVEGMCHEIQESESVMLKGMSPEEVESGMTFLHHILLNLTGREADKYDQDAHTTD